MRIRGQVCVLLCAVVLAGCGRYKGPKKPVVVPAEAFFVGTRKSGVFVVIGPKAQDGWILKIYDDHSGQLKAEGIYILQGFARSEITAEDMASWDGRALLLTDGARMVPRP